MAIKRCPYCKAIVEEDSGFCSNCGTRLLFPEDEFKDEEIPGDKIAEEEELPSEQPEEAEADEGGSQEEEKEEEEMEPEEGGQEKAADSEETEKKEIEEFLESLKKDRAKRAKGKAAETLEDIPSRPPEKVEEVREVPLETEKEEKEEEIKREAPPKSGEMEFKTEELDQIPDAKTREKEDIERFLASLREEAAKTPSPREGAPPAPQEKEGVPESLEEKIPHETPGRVDTDEQLFIRKEIEEKLKTGFKAAMAEEMPDAEKTGTEEFDRFLESVKKERAEKAGTREEGAPPAPEKISKGTAEIGEKLPPWAERVQKGTSLKVEVEEEKEAAPELGRELQEAEEEVEEEVIEEEPPLSQKEPELRKRVEEVGLPFEGEIEQEGEVKKQAPSRLSIWLKSRAFDLLSMAVLWIISIWLASRLMEVSLFKLILVSALPSLAFYLVLLVVYFSFFMLLLGETLGDLIFSREE